MFVCWLTTWPGAHRWSFRLCPSYPSPWLVCEAISLGIAKYSNGINRSKAEPNYERLATTTRLEHSRRSYNRAMTDHLFDRCQGYFFWCWKARQRLPYICYPLDLFCCNPQIVIVKGMVLNKLAFYEPAPSGRNLSKRIATAHQIDFSLSQVPRSKRGIRKQLRRAVLAQSVVFI